MKHSLYFVFLGVSIQCKYFGVYLSTKTHCILFISILTYIRLKSSCHHLIIWYPKAVLDFILNDYCVDIFFWAKVLAVYYIRRLWVYLKRIFTFVIRWKTKVLLERTEGRDTYIEAIISRSNCGANKSTLCELNLRGREMSLEFKVFESNQMNKQVAYAVPN